MRTKQIITGFNNSQRFRAIINGVIIGDNEVKDLVGNRFPDTTQRVAVWEALIEIAITRRVGKPSIQGISKEIRGYDIQVDLL
jgi:hypothetical protein